MRSYELMMIHRPELTEPDVRTLVGEVEGVIGTAGTVSDTDFWGKRRFAYEIDHLSEGYYALVTFQAEAGAVDDVDRALSLSDNVLRHKFIRPE